MSAPGFICGTPKGRRKKFRCACCGYESDNGDAFAMSTCWACMGNANFDCKNCRKQGIAVNDMSLYEKAIPRGTFRAPRPWPDKTKERMHRFTRWLPGGHHASMRCRARIARKNMGGATAVGIPPCTTCWPKGY